jgi:hypothetical protein
LVHGVTASNNDDDDDEACLMSSLQTMTYEVGDHGASTFKG